LRAVPLTPTQLTSAIPTPYQTRPSTPTYTGRRLSDSIINTRKPSTTPSIASAHSASSTNSTTEPRPVRAIVAQIDDHLRAFGSQQYLSKTSNKHYTMPVSRTDSTSGESIDSAYLLHYRDPDFPGFPMPPRGVPTPYSIGSSWLKGPVSQPPMGELP